MLEVNIEQQRIRIGQRFSVSFQRTLRIPDDGRTYPLHRDLALFPCSKSRITWAACRRPGSPEAASLYPSINAKRSGPGFRLPRGSPTR